MLWPRRIAYLALALALIWAGGLLGLSGVRSLLPLLGLMPIEAALQWAARRRRPAFEQALARLQEPAQMLALIRGERLLALVTPAYLQGKLADVYRQLGQHRQAAAAFRLALEESPDNGSFPLALGLADSLYELGEAGEAERVYRSALDEEHAPARACRRLGRLIRQRGGSLEETETYLRRAVEQAPELRARCELCAVLAERGKVDEAEWLLQLCEEASDEEKSAVSAELAVARRALEEARARPVTPPEAAPRRG